MPVANLHDEQLDFSKGEDLHKEEATDFHALKFDSKSCTATGMDTFVGLITGMSQRHSIQTWSY